MYDVIVQQQKSRTKYVYTSGNTKTLPSSSWPTEPMNRSVVALFRSNDGPSVGVCFCVDCTIELLKVAIVIAKWTNGTGKVIAYHVSYSNTAFKQSIQI